MSDGPRAWVLDACVLYPTVLREILIGCARQGLYAPLWSERILAEWVRAAAKHGGAVDEAFAQGEVATLGVGFPAARVTHGALAEDDLWLPDPADIHVLATARAGRAQGIVTLNLKDFPRRELGPLGLEALHPDPFLLDLLSRAPDVVAEVVTRTHDIAQSLAGEVLDLRALLKRARLPRLGKALSR